MSETSNSDSDKTKTWLEQLKDAVTILGGITAVAVALLWYLGRAYALGYFNALNIPVYQINYSVWDYGEAGLKFVLLGFGIAFLFFIFGIWRIDGLTLPETISPPTPWWIRFAVLVITLLIAFMAAYGVFTANILLKDIIVIVALVIANSVPVRNKKQSTKLNIDKSMLPGVYIARILLLGVRLGVLLFLLDGIASEWGNHSGYVYITEEVPRVRLTLAGSLLNDVPNPTPVVVNNDTLFRYDGLYLLTYNDTRYFLFQSINSECKPEQVYVLQEEHIRNIEYIDIPPLKPDCVPATPTPVPLTPTPTTVSTQPPATPTP